MIKSRLVQDDSGHWYVIPHDKENFWYEFMSDPEMPYMDLPAWAKQVDGPHTLYFSEWGEDD